MKSRLVHIAIGLGWIGLGPISSSRAQAPGVPATSLDQTVGGQTPATATGDSITEGKALFQRECASCHGSTGKGNGPEAATLKVKPSDLSSPQVAQATDGALYSKITEGKTPMPSFRSKLTKREVVALVKYIRT